MCVCVMAGPKGWGPNPEQIGSRRVGNRRVGSPKFRVFSLSHPHFPSFCLLVEFLVLFEASGALKCARLEFFGCCMKPRWPRSRRGSALVCPLTREGEAKPRTATTSEWSPPRGCQTTEGGALPRAGWQWRQGSLGCARKRGRRPLSDETAQFLRGLASAKVRDVPQILQGRAHAAWMRRWSSARAFALSLLDRDCSTGVDGHTPSVHEVLGESCHFE